MHTDLSGRTSTHQTPIRTGCPRMNIIPSKRLADTTTLQRGTIGKRATAPQRRSSAQSTGRGRSHRGVPRQPGNTDRALVRSTWFGCSSGRASSARRCEGTYRWTRGRSNAATNTCWLSKRNTVHLAVLRVLLLSRILKRQSRHLGRWIVPLSLLLHVARYRREHLVWSRRHCSFSGKGLIIHVLLVVLLSHLLWLLLLIHLLLLLMMVLLQSIRSSTNGTCSGDRRSVLRVLVVLLLLLRLIGNTSIRTVSLTFIQLLPNLRLLLLPFVLRLLFPLPPFGFSDLRFAGVGLRIVV